MEKYISIAGQIGGRWRENIIDLHDQSVPGLPRVATQAGRRGEGCWWGGVWSAGWLGGGFKKVKSQSQISFSLLSLLSLLSFVWLIWLMSIPCWHDKSSPLSRLTSWPPPAPPPPVTLSFPGSALTLTASIKMTRNVKRWRHKQFFFPSLHQQSNDLDKVTCVSRHFCSILFIFHSAVLPNSAAMTLWVLHSVNLISRMSELLMWRTQPPAAWILNVVFFGCWTVKATLPSYNSPFLSAVQYLMPLLSDIVWSLRPAQNIWKWRQRVAFQQETCRIRDLLLNWWALGIK